MEFEAVPHKDVLVVERHDHVVHVQHVVSSQVRRGRHFTSQSFMSQLQHGRNSRLVGGSLQLRAWLSQTQKGILWQGRFHPGSGAVGKSIGALMSRFMWWYMSSDMFSGRLGGSLS